MRVTENSSAISLLQQMETHRANQARLQKNLSTQQEIHVGSDDPTKFGEVKINYSLERAMQAFRANLHRGALITDLSEQHLDFTKTIAGRAIDTSNLLSTQINDRDLMATNANFINELIEQALDALNTRNGNNYLFSGATTRIKPYEALRTLDGDISATGKQTVGVTESVIAGQQFDLIPGVRYEIVDDTGTTIE